MDLLQAIIIAIVEGLTEYLPVSSTAHMIFTRELMGIAEDDFFKIFALCIQFGAILAVFCQVRICRTSGAPLGQALG